DLGRRRDRLGLSDDALTDHLALDRAAPERDRHTEADAPFVHAVVPAGLEVVTHVARFAADSDAAVAELAGQEADADVPNEVRIVFRLEHGVIAHRAGAEDHERCRARARHETIAHVEADAVLIVVRELLLSGLDQIAERLHLPEPAVGPLAS